MSYSMMMMMMITGDDDYELRSLTMLITVTQWYGIAYKYVLTDMD